MNIVFSNTFLKQYRKSPKSNQEVVSDRIDLFRVNRLDPCLHNHKLHGKYRGHRSINITGDWRAIFHIVAQDETVEFVLLGTHSELYG